MSEYWIDETGDVTYCDGDAGVDVPNHEAVAVAHAAHLVADQIASKADGVGYAIIGIIDDHMEDVIDCIALRSDICNAVDEWLQNGDITEEEADDIYGMMVDRYGVDRDLLSIITRNDRNDPRAYAVEKWDWIRVINDNFDVRTLDDEHLGRIRDFIDEEMEHKPKTVNIEVARHEESRVPRFLMGIPTHYLRSTMLIRKHLRSEGKLTLAVRE